LNSETWFILDRGKVAGPFSLEQLTSQRAQGSYTSFARLSQDRASWVPFDQQLAEVRARANAPIPIRPPMRTGIPATTESNAMGTPSQRQYRVSQAEVIHPFPLVALLLLHYLTASIYTFFWITRAHGLLPKIKTDDPSATKAISLCFLPFFNIYWIVAMYVRLARRVNSISAAYRLPRLVPVTLTYAMTVLLVIPLIMFTAGGVLLVVESFSDAPINEILLMFFQIPCTIVLIDLVLLVPIFAVLVQRSLNQIAFAQLELLLQSQS
jgi:hypothetical protein